MPFVRHRGAYSVLLTYDNLCIAQTSKTGRRGCHCDLEQYMSCLNYVYVYGFREVLTRSARCFYFLESLLFCDNLQTHLGVLLLGRVLLIGTLRYIQGPMYPNQKLWIFSHLGRKGVKMPLPAVFYDIHHYSLHRNKFCLTHSGLVMLYGYIDFGQHWLR